MDFRPRPEPPGARPAPRARRRGRGLRTLVGLWALGFALLFVSPARCDERVLVGGLLDAEFWKTGDGSRLLSRNEGEAAPAARLRLWAASEFLPRLQGFDNFLAVSEVVAHVDLLVARGVAEPIERDGVTYYRRAAP